MPAVLDAPGAAHARRSAERRRSSTTSPGSGCTSRNLQSTTPDQNEFPDFDDNLRQAFQRERSCSSSSVIREDRSVLDLLTRRLHVRQRAAGAALRHPEHLRQPISAASPSTDDARRGCWARAASCSSPRTPTAPRRLSAASGFSTTCSARRRPRRRRTCRRSKESAEAQPQYRARADGAAPREPGRARAATS